MLSNYGIKRMLPRLIVAAILVNISYYISQAAVDISNILGSSMYSLLTSVPINLDASGNPDYTSEFGTWSTLLAGALVTGALGIGLVLAISMGTAGLIALIMIVLILVARQALVVLLVVISPIAFVAYLLPNTEDWFKKWWKSFWAVLMVFPVVGLIFGASQLAAKILALQDGEWMKIVALGVSVIPLFAVPLVLKGSLSAAGAIGTKLQGLSDSANARAKGKIKEGRSGEFLAAQKQRRQLRGARIRQSRFNPMSRLDQGRLGRVTGGAKGRAAAISAVDEAFQSDVKNAHIEQNDIGFDGRQAIALTGTTGILKNADGSFAKDKNGNFIGTGKKVTAAQRAAAAEYMMQNGNFEDRSNVISSVGSLKANSAEDRKVLQTVGEGYYKSGMNNVYGSAMGNQISQGAFSGVSPGSISDKMDEEAIRNASEGKLNPHVFADSGQAQYMERLVKSGKAQGGSIGNIAAAAAAANDAARSGNIQLSAQSSNAIASIDQLSNATPTHNRSQTHEKSNTVSHSGQSYEQSDSGLYIPRE